MSGLTAGLELDGLRLRGGASAYGFGLRLWSGGRRRADGIERGQGRGDFPVAAILNTRAKIAELGALFDDVGRAALRAGLVDGLVRRSEIAIGVAAAAVEDPRATSAAFR